MITRRNFLKSLVLVPAVIAAGKVKFLLEPEPSLLGVPYHQNNGTIGTWLGIDRSSVAMWKPYPKQIEFFNTPLDTKFVMLAGRRR